MGVIERSSFCRARISFALEIGLDLDHARAGQDHHVISADIATLKF